MAQIYPLDIARIIERRWHSRSKGALCRATINADVAGGGICPNCNHPAAIAPTSSEYRAKGTIRHRWLCGACGHDWITVVHVPS